MGMPERICHSWSVQSHPFPWSDDPELERHADVIDRLRRAVDADERWRWLEVGCSLGRGVADELSDIDAGVGYIGLEPEDLDAAGLELVANGGSVVDALAHVLRGWSPDTRRIATEYDNGVQLDLVLLPAARRPGLPPGSVALADKDGRLATPWRPPVADPPTPQEAREWVLLAWWAISDVAKYLARGALYEATERLTEARQHALQLWTAGRGIPYPAFGLVSLLDFPPYEVPAALTRTYCVPDDAAAVRAAADAVAQLVRDATASAETALRAALGTPWADIAERRLAAPRPSG